jgi:pyrroline-5-carboxylate reductase
MNLGFIGTGTIASCVITGIFKSKITFNKIYISKRNKKNSEKLKRKYKKVLLKIIIRKL